ncbi:MAG: peptidoglycan-binding domain-containing protein [Pseudomonadota bacterium]
MPPADPTIDDLDAALKAVRAAALADGILTDLELAQIAGVEAKIAEVRAKLGVSATSLTKAVGKGAPNKPDDVIAVQLLLQRRDPTLAVDGDCGPKTIAAIRAFQEDAFGWNDGRIDPGGQSWTTLSSGGQTKSATSPAPPREEETPEATDEPETSTLGGEVGRKSDDPRAERHRPEEAWDDTEYPFVRNKEFALGTPLGEFKIKFNDKGQVQAREVSKSTSLAELTENRPPFFVHLEAKIGASIEAKRKGASVETVMKLGASGTGFIATGAAKKDSKAGLGVELELTASEEKVIDSDIGMDMLEALAKLPEPKTSLIFRLPVTLKIKAAQSIALAASLPGDIANPSMKIATKEYDPIATITMNEDGSCDLKGHPNLYEFLGDLAATASPIDMGIKLMLEMRKYADNPDTYWESKEQEYRDRLKKIKNLPADMKQTVEDEIERTRALVEKALGQEQEPLVAEAGLGEAAAGLAESIAKTNEENRQKVLSALRTAEGQVRGHYDAIFGGGTVAEQANWVAEQGDAEGKARYRQAWATANEARGQWDSYASPDDDATTGEIEVATGEALSTMNTFVLAVSLFSAADAGS